MCLMAIRLAAGEIEDRPAATLSQTQPLSGEPNIAKP